MIAPATAPAVELRNIVKSFPGVRALKGVSLSVRQGEIHALLGENGAGKSTLVKILAGLLTPDSGSILLNGAEVELRNPREARRQGVTVVPQEVEAVPGFSAGRNVLLGLESTTASKDRLSADEAARVRMALERAGASFDASRPAAALSAPEIRLCQIARTLVSPGDVILLDEPTAVLSDTDAAALLERLETFRAEGKAIIYVSHRLSEVLRIADRITVLRDGERVGTFVRNEVSREHIINLMAKSDVAPAASATQPVEQARDQEGDPILRVEGVSYGHSLNDVDFSVRAGEIVGIAGVQGSGHGYLLGAVAGRFPCDRGVVMVDGRPLGSSLLERYRAGLVLVPADRRAAAIVPTMKMRENIVLPRESVREGKMGFRRRAAERAVAARLADMFLIRPRNTEALAAGLSGGNQQKVALARAVQSHPRVLLLEEPTQGIDVNAKAEIRALVQRLAREERVGVVIATSEFEDLLGLADVIHVMCLGRIAATLPGGQATYERILHHALP